MFLFLLSAEVTSQKEQEDLTSHIRRRHAADFGHVHRLPEEAPGRMAMPLVDTRAGGRPDNSLHWKRRPGDTSESDKWRSTPVPPLMLHGTLPSTVAVGGRYDPSWSSDTDDDDDFCRLKSRHVRPCNDFLTSQCIRNCLHYYFYYLVDLQS